MKKIVAMLAFVSLFACLAACGGTSESDTTPPDLTGEWKQTNSNSSDSWQSATISENTIEVYWVSDNGETKSLYWSGTYTAPTAGGTYSWDSENDKSKTDLAILASGDDTKTFTYKNGELSYSVSAMGTETTVKLKKE